MPEQNERAKELKKILTQGQKVIETAQTSNNPNATPEVQEEKFHAFRIVALSWLTLVFGDNHTSVRTFKSEVTLATLARTKRAIGILEAARTELEGEWLPTTRSSLAKDMLSSILRHARMQQEAKNLQAAVIICGSVTDELLRRICLKAQISLINEQMKGKPVAKKALQLTGEAYKRKIFDRTVNKQFITCIELFEEQIKADAPTPAEHKVGEMLDTLQKLLPILPL